MSDTHAPKSAVEPVKIVVAHGDGIGPEIMAARLRILDAAGANLDVESIVVGEAIYRQGHTSGIEAAARSRIRAAKAIYKAPISTRQGGGYKSLDVTLRKTLALFANMRPCRSHRPYIDALHPDVDMVTIRENEEDLYAGIERRQTGDVYRCLKLISLPGCECIVRYAFDYARAHGRRKVSCFTKDNIRKLTDGPFHKVFDEIAPDYPKIEIAHLIVDFGAAKLAADPGRFDVLVLLNLHGGILSDVAADIGGRGIANPSGLSMAGIPMLDHIGRTEVAARAHNAWLKTVEDGTHTADIAGPKTRVKTGTQGFAEAVIERLGQIPARLPPVRAHPAREFGKTECGPGLLVRPSAPRHETFR